MNLELIYNNFFIILSGLDETLKLVIISLSLGFVIAIPFALARASSNRILSEIMYDYSKNDLEYYVSYLHLKELFNENCKSNARIPNYLFIEKIFKHGFLPVYNYKSILN